MAIMLQAIENDPEAAKRQLDKQAQHGRPGCRSKRRCHSGQRRPKIDARRPRAKLRRIGDAKGSAGAGAKFGPPFRELSFPDQDLTQGRFHIVRQELVPLHVGMHAILQVVLGLAAYALQEVRHEGHGQLRS
jgi:hypothetical protein